MQGSLVGAVAAGRTVAFCHSEHLWHVISSEDDVKADAKIAKENEAKRLAQLPVGSKIGNK